MLWNELKNRCEARGVRFVGGEGNPHAKMWIVGEALGEAEEKQGRPFAGPSGWFLDKSLRQVCVNRAGCFVTNVVPVRPPGNVIGRLGEMGLSLRECTESLREMAATFAPNCVLALGGVALEALTGEKGLVQWRGFVGEGPAGRKVVASFHPAHILRMGEKTAKKERENKGGLKYTYGTARATFLADLKRVREESQEGRREFEKWPLRWDMEKEEVLKVVEKMRRAPRVAFDIETKGSWVDRIALADEEEAVSMELEDGEVREKVKELLGAHQGLITHHGVFDIEQLRQNGVVVGGLWGDSMVLHHLLYPEFPHSLDYLASLYCRLPAPPHAPGWAEPQNRGRANALHAGLTIGIHELLEEEARELEEKGGKNVGVL